MNTNEHNKQEGKNIELQSAEQKTTMIEVGDAYIIVTPDGHEPCKKKYHSSAMYATSKLHDAVGHVRPKHTGINL